MRISKREFDSLASFIRKKSNEEIGPAMRYAISGIDPRKSNRDLQSLGAERLTELIQILPSGRGTSFSSPLLTKLKKKARQSLAGLRVPHLDPESWPQIYRMQMRLNNSRAGLRDFGMGQIGKMHPKGKSLSKPLRITSVWDTSEAGDLVIMGPWADIAKMLSTSSGTFRAKFDDMYDGDVNVEFDRKYGPPKGESPDWFEKISAMPLYVTMAEGAQYTKTESEGHVVLNAPGEIVDLVGSKVTAIAGAVAPESLGDKTMDIINEIKGVMEDHVIPAVQSGMEQHAMVKEEKLNKTLCTVTVGIGPAGKNYAVGKQSMTAAEILQLARKLR